MDQINSFIDLIYNHWAAVLVIAPFLYSIIGKLGRAGIIMIQVGRAMKDRTIGDTEAATIFWMLISVLLGLTPHVSYRLLDFCPDQQVAILKGRGFIVGSYRPEVEAATNGGGQ